MSYQHVLIRWPILNHTTHDATSNPHRLPLMPINNGMRTTTARRPRLRPGDAAAAALCFTSRFLKKFCSSGGSTLPTFATTAFAPGVLDTGLLFVLPPTDRLSRAYSLALGGDVKVRDMLRPRWRVSVVVPLAGLRGVWRAIEIELLEDLSLLRAL
jgi:hypothetical protein